MPSRNLLTLTRLCKICESKQRRRHKQHDADNQQTGTENLLHGVFEKHSHNTNRNHRNDDVYGIFRAPIEVFIRVPLLFGEQILENPHHFVPKNHQGGAYRSDMQHHVESEVLLAAHPKNIRQNSKMSAA